MKYLFILFLTLSQYLFAANIGASLSIAPTTLFVNQRLGASLAVINDTGSSVRVLSITPATWWTNTGSSTVSVAWGMPFLGPGANITIGPSGGASLSFAMDSIFFAPSIFPPYQWQTSPYGLGASLVQAGTQTFSMRMIVLTSDGRTTYSSTQSATVLPLTLPSTQQ